MKSINSFSSQVLLTDGQVVFFCLVKKYEKYQKKKKKKKKTVFLSQIADDLELSNLNWLLNY